MIMSLEDRYQYTCYAYPFIYTSISLQCKIYIVNVMECYKLTQIHQNEKTVSSPIMQFLKGGNQ